MATTSAALSTQVNVEHDAGALDRQADALDELLRATGAPVTARRPWLTCWLRTHQDVTPLVVTVRRNGELVAAAVLVRRHRALWDEVLPAGAGESDEVRLPARDDRAARDLAVGVREALRRLQHPWRLVFRDLATGDPVVGHLLALMPWSAVRPGNASPGLRLGPQRDLRGYVTRNHHQQERRLRNRLEREGHRLGVQQLVKPADIAAAWPEITRICRARDLAVRGWSAMDDPAAAAFFADVVATHAGRQEVQITALHVDGRMAAYVLNFVDGVTWRMWNCRFDPAWGSYGVGRLSHDEALRAALAAGAELYDWMRGEEPYKRGLADHLRRAEDLHAASSRLLWSAWAGGRRARVVAGTLRERSPAIERALARLSTFAQQQQQPQDGQLPRHGQEHHEHQTRPRAAVPRRGVRNAEADSGGEVLLDQRLR